MKKVITLSMIAALALSACHSGKTERAKESEALNQATREELATAVAERDQLFSLYNDINQGMEQIKQLENILTVSNALPGESVSQREQIMSDIAAIQKTLQDRREKLSELEKKLASSNQSNNTLRQSIANLRAQLESQTEEIISLKDNLEQARQRIGKLDATVDSLTTTVTTVTDERDVAQEENVNLANELNTCYYAIGSKSELKDRHIIETGFLRKTKLMKGDFDQSFFTTADKRTLSRIALHSKKAEVLTNQPEGSYIIDSDNGQKVLVITNPDAFWSLSNYLVIKID